VISVGKKLRAATAANIKTLPNNTGSCLRRTQSGNSSVRHVLEHKVVFLAKTTTQLLGVSITYTLRSHFSDYMTCAVSPKPHGCKRKSSAKSSLSECKPKPTTAPVLPRFPLAVNDYHENTGAVHWTIGELRCRFFTHFNEIYLQLTIRNSFAFCYSASYIQ